MMKSTVLLLASAVLSLVCICMTCVMLAGSSDNEDVLQNCAWGRKQVPLGNLYMGTTSLMSIGMIWGDDDLYYYGLPDDCKSAGRVAIVMTSLLLVLNLAVFAMGLARLTKASAPSYPLKVAVIITTIIALLCDIIAIGYYSHKCLGGNTGAEPGVSMYLGFVMMFLLAIICSLQVVARATAAGALPSYNSSSAATPGRPLLNDA